jgi:outer membrane protein OmpA-like peptidoglycan-associated protein
VYAETGADPLLEQTRILGKVFDDQDGDGWQDPGERGVPGVRIASVNGLVSETDAYGRYHQEGIILLNQERGMNYVLKLDRASLPPGTTITTENPLLRRVTAAIPVRFDFGVKLPPMPAASAKQEDLALGEINFTPGSTEIRPEYMGVLDRMAGEIHAHQTGEVFIDSASGNSPLAFERAGKVRDELVNRLSPEERNAFTITVRLQAADGTTGTVGLSDEVLLGQVFFDTDKSTIRPEFEGLLDKIAANIESVGSGRVSIVGHADLRASTEYNQALGMRRANSVYDAIAKRLSPEARTKLSVEVEGAVVAPGAGQ